MIEELDAILKELDRAKYEPPELCPGCTISADGERMEFYRKGLRKAIKIVKRRLK